MKSSFASKLRQAKRGTAQLNSMNINRIQRRSTLANICLRGPFKDKFYSFFISQFDASIVILPFIFKRSGWLFCSMMLCALSSIGVFTSILMYECIRLLLGNFKMKQQGVDFESLIANFKHISTHGSFTASNHTPWLSSSLSSESMVGIIRNLYLASIILSSAIGLILCQYSFDNMYKWLNNGKVFALQLMPEAKILNDNESSDHQPF